MMMGAGATNSVPEGGVSGIFSVSSTKKVYFAMGNVQYNEDGYYGKAKFADHQWEIVGDATQGDVYYDGVKCDNNKLKRGFAGWADLFEWGGNMSQNSAVLDIDIGNRDLLQCTDAVMLLRAEYLYSQKRYKEIHFNALSSKRLNYTDYVQGDYSRAKFRKYMDYVFACANTASFIKELKPRSINDVQIGDVSITTGNPGHAMIVVDMALDKDGNRSLLLAQGMMPARSVHVVTNLEHGEDTPWYLIDKYLEWSTLFVFPNYVFSARTDLKCFE